MQSLDIISVNIWQIIISLANLLIMFLIIRRFLFKPVQKMLETRRKQVEDVYAEADEKRAAAIGMKQEYEAKLAAAREEADGLVRSAVQTAQKRSDAIVAEASHQASHLKQKAAEEIAQEKQQMLRDVQAVGPASVRVCTLLFKPDAFRGNFKVDYIGRPIGNEFIVGYGMDYDEQGRTLPEIMVRDIR